MTLSDKLTAIKVDLGITTGRYDERLVQYLETAKKQIENEGVTLQDDVADGNLVVIYAAWMWRRRDTGEGMPRMVRYALNSRVIRERVNRT